VGAEEPGRTGGSVSAVVDAVVATEPEQPPGDRASDAMPDAAGRPEPAWSRTAALVVAAGTVLGVLAVDPGGLRPFTTLRWPVVAVPVLIAAALVRPPPGILARWFRWTAAIFGLAVVLATVTALDPVTAVLGHPRRHLGLLAVVTAAAAFRVGTGVGGPVAARIVGRGLIVAAAALGTVAAAEALGWEPAGVGFAGPRLGGPFGQPAYLGAAGVLLAPAAWAAARSEQGAWRRLGQAGAVAAAAAVVGSQTRGAWVGLAAAAVVAWPGLRPRRWSGRWSGPALAGAVVAVIVAVALLTPLGARATAALDLDGGTSRGRLDEWRVAAAAVAERPALGAGPEGYRLVAPAHIDDDYARRYGRAVLVDRAHDGVLDVATAAGLPAALAYTALVAGVVARAWRVRRHPAPLVTGAAAAFTGYMVQQVFLFPVAEVDPLAWLLAGLVMAAPQPHAHAHRRFLAPMFGLHPKIGAKNGGAGGRAIGTGAIVIAASGLALVIAGLGAADVLADHHLAAADRARGAGDDRRAEHEARAAVALRPDSIDVRYAAVSLLARGPGLLDVDAALDEVAEGRARSSLDPALADLEEQLLLTRAVRSELPEDAARARGAAAARLAADPANGAHHRRLGIAAALAGDDAAATAALHRALDLDPDDTAARAALDELRAPKRG
jgi:hypothetical protein